MVEYSNLLKVLNKEMPASIPVIITGGAKSARLYNVDFSEIRVNASIMAEANINFQRATGMDWVFVYSDPLYVYEAIGCEVKVSSVSGPFVEKTLPENKFGDIPSVKFYEIDSCKAVLDAVELIKTNTDLPVAALIEGPFTTAMRTYEASTLMKKLYKKPQSVQELLESLVNFLIMLIKELKRRGASIFYIPEPFASQDTISFNHFNEFAVPWIKALVSYIKSINGYPILHICGHTEDRLKKMVSTGALALSLDQKVNLQKAREIVGPEVVLTGNVDPINTLWLDNPSEVTLQSEDCIVKGGPASFILSPGCGIPPDTPLENIKAMVKTAKAFHT